MKINLLHKTIEQVCPIDGCSSANEIWFKEEATEEQKQLAWDIYNNWEDPPDADVTGFVMALANNQTLNNWYEKLSKIVSDMMASYLKDRDFKSLNSLVLGLNLTEEIKTELNILINEYDIPLII
jgi:hypothetical protein